MSDKLRILPSGVTSWCSWCDGIIESENHLSVSCPIVWGIWSLIHRWFGVTWVVPSTMSSMCKSFLKVYRTGKHGHNSEAEPGVARMGHGPPQKIGN
jgi:hypothetical protein